MERYTLISGATGGLGKAFCEECASRGFNLFITATREQRLKDLRTELLQKYPNIKIECKECNLSDNESRIELMNFAKQKNCVLERIILNAGIDFEGPILEQKPEEIQKVISVNVEGTIHIFNLALLEKISNETFYVIIVGSLAGYYSMPQKAIYASSKAMLINFFTAMHEELKDEKVNVLTVCPGGMPTTQEMINSINSQGLSGKLSSTNMDIVAKNSLKSSFKNKNIYIPGTFNRFLKVIASPFSRKFVAGRINSRWKKTRKKAKELGN